MTEKKDLGIEIAKDPTEARWFKVRDDAKEQLAQMELNMEITKKVMELAESKIPKK